MYLIKRGLRRGRRVFHFEFVVRWVTPCFLRVALRRLLPVVVVVGGSSSSLLSIWWVDMGGYAS